jgi:Do/DeqQ family serine protease
MSLHLVSRSGPIGRVLILALLLVAPGADAALPLTAEGLPATGLAPMLERVLPSVVNISTRARVRVRENPLLSDPFFRRFFDLPDVPRQKETQSTGSGVIVDAAKGYILTNHHVIEEADEITVTLRDGRALDADIVGVDPEVDLAVIRIKADDLVAVPMGDSSKLRVGDVVVAIGSPFGLGQTVTAGIVSALGRTGLGIEGYEDFIQTDASINPGNSGGPLVNIAGELVGINTAIVGPAGGNIGIGFAIPSTMVSYVMQQILTYGEVRRGELGLTTQDLKPELAQAFGLDRWTGAIVVRVDEGSPAAAAGLRAHDVITAVNGKPVRNSSALRNAIGLQPIGTEIDMDVMREGRRRKIRAVIAEPRPSSMSSALPSRHLAGATVGAITADHPLYGHIEGVEILQVDRGSAAAQAGLRGGDIIVEINRQPVRSVDELKSAMGGSSDSLLLQIRRGRASILMVIQ